jgi:hypothetical protein
VSISLSAFDPPSSELRFRRSLQDHGVRIDHMTVAEGATAFLDFYDATRFTVSPEEEGDALRIEWDAASSGDGQSRLTLARDFAWPSTTAKDHLERWSLWMTFHGSAAGLPVDALNGRHRCGGQGARAACAAFLRELPLYRTLASRVDEDVEIGFDPTPPS